MEVPRQKHMIVPCTWNLWLAQVGRAKGSEAASSRGTSTTLPKLDLRERKEYWRWLQQKMRLFIETIWSALGSKRNRQEGGRESAKREKDRLTSHNTESERDSLTGSTRWWSVSILYPSSDRLESLLQRTEVPGQILRNLRNFNTETEIEVNLLRDWWTLAWTPACNPS